MEKKKTRLLEIKELVTAKYNNSYLELYLAHGRKLPNMVHSIGLSSGKSQLWKFPSSYSIRHAAVMLQTW